MIPQQNLTSHIPHDKMTQISDSANSGFRLLIRQANAARQKFAESSSSSNSGETEAILASQDLEPEPGEYTDGDWRIIMSDKLSRPFFFNTKTGLGSFAVPKEIAGANDAAEVGAVSASQKEVCISLCESVNNGKRKRSPSIDILVHEDHALSQTLLKSGSTGDSFEIPNAIKIDDTGTAAAVRNLIFVTEGETPVVAKSFDRSNHVVSDIKKSQDTPTIEILDDDDDDDKDDDEDVDKKVKKVEKGTEGLHAPDLTKKGDHDTINVSNSDKHGVVESAYQSTDSTQLDINQSNEKISNGSSSRNSLMESNISHWSCSQCTFENKSSAFTCCMCGMHSGRQRRSLRDSQNTIMQGFALTQSQQSNYSTDVFPGSWR